MEQDFSIPPIEPTPTPTPALHVDTTGRFFLQQTAKWAKFLAIVGFVMCGFMVIAAFAIGSVIGGVMSMGAEEMPGMGMIGGGMFTVIYLLIAVLLFFPNMYLLNFANKMQAALASDDQPTITESFRFLRAYYRYIGIFIIVMICFYALVFILLLITSMASGL